MRARQSFAPFAYALGASLFTCACGGAVPPPPSVTAAPPAPPAVAQADAECVVWAREASFAQSVADHDGKAFHEHVHAKAVFVDGDGTYLRGREAIVVAWRTIVEGQKVRLVWHPAAVALTGDGGVAVSRGPYVFEDLRPDAKQRFRTGTFQSTWVRDADGVWRVTVDGGTPPPAPATEEEAKKLLAEMRVQCPRK
jgi:uncharacterized protein (TIGR02246 family)